MPLCPSFTWRTYSVHYLRDLLFAYALLRPYTIEKCTAKIPGAKIDIINA